MSFWLALGLALYFAGTALFRHGLKLGGVVPRLVAGVAGGLLWLLPLPPAGLLGLAVVIAIAAVVADAMAGRVRN